MSLSKRTNKSLAVVDIRRLFKEKLKLPFKERNPGDLWFPCQKHGEEENTSHPDAHIDVRPKSPYYGRWHCFGCGASGNYFSIIKDRLRCTWKEVPKLVELYATGETVEVVVEVSEKRDVRLPSFYEAPKRKEEWPAKFSRYLERRGITWEQTQRFEVGFIEAGELHGRVVAPIYLGKEFRNFVARSVESNCTLKVTTAKGGKPGLFGSQYVYPRMPALVFEGWFDALAADRTGYLNAYAIGTNRINQEQIRFLSRFPYVIVVADNDDGGKIMVDSFAAYHETHDIRVAQVEKFFGNCKDASELLERHHEDRLVDSIKASQCWEPSREEFVVEVIL